MNIRKARIEDLEELLNIYNYEVINGISTLDLFPKTLKDWQSWFDAHNVDNHPLYVAPDHRGKGVASALMGHILAMARAMEDVHTVVSVITAGNQASVRLHQKFGFTFCGTVREVGMKFGSYRDIEMYQLMV